MPKKEKGCITTEYLMGVLTEKFFSIRRIDVKLGFPQKKATKLDLLISINEVIKPKVLGFKLTQLPERSWLESVLYSVKPDHHLFKRPPMLIEEREFNIPDW